MRNIPQLTSNAVSKDHIEEFKGYNHNERIQNTEWFDMKNMTNEHYPVASPRGKRSHQYTIKGSANENFKVEAKSLGLTYANKDLITLQPVNDGAWFFNNGLPIMLNNEKINLAFEKVPIKYSKTEIEIQANISNAIISSYINAQVLIMLVVGEKKYVYKEVTVLEVAENYIKLSGDFDIKENVFTADVKIINLEKLKTLDALKNKINTFKPTDNKDRVDGRKRSLVKNGSYICTFPDGIVYESNNKDDEIPVKQVQKEISTQENENWYISTIYKKNDEYLAITQYDNVKFRLVCGQVQEYLEDAKLWANLPTYVQIAVSKDSKLFNGFEKNETVKIISNIFKDQKIETDIGAVNKKIEDKVVIGDKGYLIFKGYLKNGDSAFIDGYTEKNKFNISNLSINDVFCTVNGRQYLYYSKYNPNICFACYAHITEGDGEGWTLPIMVCSDPGGIIPDGSYRGAEGYYFKEDWLPNGYSSVTTSNELEFEEKTWYYTPNAGAMPGNVDSTNGNLIKAEGDFKTTKDVALYMIEQYYLSKNIELSRKCPDIAFACESQNRIWGCSKDGHEIYASALGNPYEYYDFSGLSTDSYAVNVGTNDEFTGCCNYLGYPIFFKESSAHLVSGNYPAQYAVTTLTEFRGVEKGSEKSLVVIDNILYYKSAAGIVAFDGASAIVVSEQLGDERYKNAVAGSYNGKYYVSMENSKGEYNLFVFDTRKGTWCKEDNTEIWQTINVGNQLIYSDGKNINCITDENVVGFDEYKSEDDIEWFAETGIFGYSYANQKYISRLQIRMYLEKGSRANLYIQYNSDGVWHSCGREIVGKGIKSFLFPIRPRRCDHMQIKIEGKGQSKIYSITKMFEEGSDVVCCR